MHFGFKPVIAADGDKRLWSGLELLSSCLAGEVFRVAVMAVLHVVQSGSGQGEFLT